MGRNNQEEMDLRKIRRLLRETTRLAERASMTGSLQGGGRIAIRQYNAIRNHLQDTGVIPEDLFQELDEDEATFDELGVVTGMLESYLEEDEVSVEVEEEQAGGEGEPRHGRRGRRHGRWDWRAFATPEAAGFWSDPQALRDLQRMGEELREHLPELLKWREQMRTGTHPTPPVPPTPPTPPSPPAPPRPANPWENGDASEAQAPPRAFGPDPELASRIREISEALQSHELDYARRMELSRELADLAAAQLG